MGSPLRFEDPNLVFFITTRTMMSRLWFVNNRGVEEKILAFLARYQELYQVILYAFVLMGNHYHLIARFPEGNKSAFMRAFNAIIAKIIASEVPQFPGGKLWGRRYADQVLPRDEDIEHWFLYAALNPVTSGICSDTTDYKGYNSFADSIINRTRKFQIFERWKFNETKRFQSQVDPEKFLHEHTLKFTKLPGNEGLTEEQYRSKLLMKLKCRRERVLELQQLSKPTLPKIRKQQRVVVGSVPRKTKTGGRFSPRPLVLTLCAKTRSKFLRRYFDLVARYRIASEALRDGRAGIEFPVGTYHPSVLTVPPRP